MMYASWIRRESSPLPNISTLQPTLSLYGPLLHNVVVVYQYISATIIEHTESALVLTMTSVQSLGLHSINSTMT